ncbi:MAG: class I SAM-dependent methyltransferase [Acidobacteria bacterium]|nr:class I SAM-dependent methyltransferase [Acidobacteriota bacterium]
MPYQIQQWNSETFFDELFARFDHLRDLDSVSHVATFRRLSGMRKEDRVVEICCGFGRLLVPLASQQTGVVTGIDQSKVLIELARKLAADRGVKINLIHADLRFYRGDGKLDIAIIAGSSIGFYCDRQEGRLIFEAARSLSPSGRTLLVDQGNRPLVSVVHKEDEEYWFERTAKFDEVTRDLAVRMFTEKNPLDGPAFRLTRCTSIVKASWLKCFPVRASMISRFTVTTTANHL